MEEVPCCISACVTDLAFPPLDQPLLKWGIMSPPCMRYDLIVQSFPIGGLFRAVTPAET